MEAQSYQSFLGQTRGASDGGSDAAATLLFEQRTCAVLFVALLCVCTGVAWNLFRLFQAMQQERAVRAFRPRPGLGLSAAALVRLHPSPAPADSSAECCICLEVVEEGMPSLALPCCGRLYHHCCAVQWLKVVARCPTCRHTVYPPVSEDGATPASVSRQPTEGQQHLLLARQGDDAMLEGAVEEDESGRLLLGTAV